MQHKTCTICHDPKPISEFPVKQNSLHGVASHCKKCLKEVNKASYARNKKRVLERAKERYLKSKQ